ncbi:MAG TPA: transcriptional regulator [Verrucomicrobiales bacterium]|nr:transcriptional regulator [Verrucomicrobiales bacterium]HIL71805.1 transcriptional regulator [Verrucomicrobiota bacterium]
MTTKKKTTEKEKSSTSKKASVAKSATKTVQKKATTVSGGGKMVGTATAASILGEAGNSGKKKTPYAVKIKPQWSKYYNNLLELREHLIQQMDGLAKESAEVMSNYSLHMADSGTDNFDRDFALSLLSSDKDAVYEIEEALKRIEKNSYGICEFSGKTISKDRLDAIPWTRYTVEAQTKLEKQGALKKRGLGQLGSVDRKGGFEPGDGDDSDSKSATLEK